MLTCEHYLTPTTLDEAFACLERFGGTARIVAGATDLLPWAREGRAGDVHYSALIDVSRIPELCGVERTGERLRIGANTTIAAFLADPLLVRHAPVLRHCAVWFADDQIREQATLGGNLVNASPAADSTPPMLAMNATVTLASRRDGRTATRTLRLTQFVLGPGKIALQPGELVTHVECDATEGYGSAFEKVGHRRSLVISTVCAAALVKLDRGASRFEDVRIALGAVGPVPERLTDCERLLIGRPVSASRIREAAELAVERVRSRTRREYRREVVVNFVERAVCNALGELGAAVAQDAAKEKRYA